MCVLMPFKGEKGYVRIDAFQREKGYVHIGTFHRGLGVMCY